MLMHVEYAASTCAGASRRSHRSLSISAVRAFLAHSRSPLCRVPRRRISTAHAQHHAALTIAHSKAQFGVALPPWLPDQAQSRRLGRRSDTRSSDPYPDRRRARWPLDLRLEQLRLKWPLRPLHRSGYGSRVQFACEASSYDKGIWCVWLKTACTRFVVAMRQLR